jgi:ADP-L-glycero-D-manno-heptose 6-epimerase
MESSKLKILVTGGAGFIGSNLVRRLNQFTNDVIIVDDLTDGRKIKNLLGLDYEFIDSEEFWSARTDREVERLVGGKLNYVFHLGAISSTSFANGKELVENNTKKSERLIKYCIRNKIGIHFASSASVYGNIQQFPAAQEFVDWPELRDVGECEPLNPYAYSKMRVDEFILKLDKEHRKFVTSFRYFNVFGPGEQHKDGQSSPVYKFWKELKETNQISVFAAKSERDFVHVDHVVERHIQLMWSSMWSSTDVHQQHTFVDVGMGISTSFLELANFIGREYGNEETKIRLIPFPPSLLGNYQFKTKANIITEPDDMTRVSFGNHHKSVMSKLEPEALMRLCLVEDMLRYLRELDVMWKHERNLLVPIQPTQLSKTH